MRKKLLSLVIVLAMLLSLMPFVPMTAYAAVEGDWLYTLYDGDTTAAITGYNGTATEIVIPPTIAGKPVTRIGSNAFLDNTTITSVTIPDSVLRIESGAFQNSMVHTIDLGDGLTYVGQNAFNGSKLANVTIPNSVTQIDNNAFAMNRNLSSVTIIGNNLSTLGDGAFSTTALSTIRIPTSLSTIKSWTFNDTYLSALTIPANITSIEYMGFGNNANLNSVIFEGNAPTMGNYVFSIPSSGFTVYYYSGATGFTTPTWTAGYAILNTVELDAPSNDVCQIGSVKYETLSAALAEAVDGDTIVLLDDVDHTSQVTITEKNLTFDLNQFTLNITNAAGIALEVGSGGKLSLTGEGSCNVYGNVDANSLYGYGVYAHDGGEASVTNAWASGYSTSAAYALNGGRINVSGNATGTLESLGTGTYCRGAEANGLGSMITVLGDVSSKNNYGAVAQEEGTVIVAGNVTGYYGGAYVYNGDIEIDGGVTGLEYGAYAIDGTISVGGDVTATANNGVGAYASGEGASVIVTGDAISQGNYGNGAFAGNGAAVVIGGDAVSEGFDGYGAFASQNNASIEISGNIMAENGTGAWVRVTGSITVDGMMTAADYIKIEEATYNKEESSEITTKLGYLTYSDGTNTVWVKEPFDDSNWINGITSASQYPFGGGDGSSEALAYEISTANQLAQLAYNVNNGNDYTGKHFKLMNDLDLAGKEWTPIGYRFYPGQEKGFNGNFDGNNYRITNIAIGSSSEPKTGGDQTQAGLFGATRYVANIYDLHVQGSLYVHNVASVGMLLGYSESNGAISGCTAEGTIVSTGSGDIRIGGLIGDTSGISVIRCSSDVDINASTGSMAVGGLIGYHGAFTYDRIRPLDSCIYTGTLTSGNVPSYGGVGGIAGKSYGYTIIYNSINKGTVTGSEGNVGGIVGIQHNEGIINCYSSGAVAGNGNYPTAVGGLTGYIDWGKVYNCYDSGRVSSTGSALVGALVGNAPSTASIVSNGYFDGTINDDLAHVRSTSGNKYYLHEFTTEVMKGADPGSDFEYADGVYANGEYAIIEALNGWIGLRQSTYPDTIFKEWNIISTFNAGYPYLTDADDPGLEHNATLAALTASGVTLSPAFSSAVTSYSANVNNSKTSVSIVATPSNSNAFVNINGDNTLTKEVNLEVGSNTITILVTAEDTITTETYTITLNRAAASSGGGSSTLTALPPVNVTTETTNGKTKNITTIDVEETNRISEANITTPMVDALLQKANETGGTDNGDLLEVGIILDEETEKLDVTIFLADLARIASQTDAGLALTSSFASITFDGRALETIAGANSGGDVLISASLVDKNTLSDKDRETIKDRPVYDFSVFNSGIQVTNFKGGKATVSVPYTLQPGENPESVVIYYLADNSSLITLRGRYDAESGFVVFTTTHFSNFVIGYNPVNFNDIATDAWYKNAVGFIAARGITSGIGNNMFGPEAKLTRAQFVVLLMNAYQISTQNQGESSQIENFSDAGNTYYTDYLLTAKALGIVNGIGNNLFDPEKEITRQEMFVVLYNALKVIDEVPVYVNNTQLSSFNDADKIASWANEALSSFVKTGTVGGYNNNLYPTATTTRAEIAQVLYNVLSK